MMDSLGSCTYHTGLDVDGDEQSHLWPKILSLDE
jgi:hypothetical protein